MTVSQFYRRNTVGIEDQVPKGWVLQSADFSLRNSTSKYVPPNSPGSVSLMRDRDGRKWWLSLSEHLRDKVELYATGTGHTLDAALEDACSKARSSGLPFKESTS